MEENDDVLFVAQLSNDEKNNLVPDTNVQIAMEAYAFRIVFEIIILKSHINKLEWKLESFGSWNFLFVLFSEKK